MGPTTAKYLSTAYRSDDRAAAERTRRAGERTAKDQATPVRTETGAGRLVGRLVGRLAATSR